MGDKLDLLLDHYMPCLLVLALCGLTMLGVGDPRRVSYMGILLCAAGYFQRPGRVDRAAANAADETLLLPPKISPRTI